MCKSVIFYFIWYVPNSTYVATGRHISTSQSFLGVVIEHLANLLHIRYMAWIKTGFATLASKWLGVCSFSSKCFDFNEETTLNTVFWNTFCFESVLSVVSSLK